MGTTAISEVLLEKPPLISFDSVDSLSRESEIQSPSSLGDDSTPDTELSLSSEPELDHKEPTTSLDTKANARKKAASLTLEEQVTRHYLLPILLTY
jgi:hypothetical protein